MAAWRLWVRFQRLFGFSPTASTLADPPSPTAISDIERLSRFVTHREDFSVTKGDVGFRAFLPPKKENDVSIMRTDSLSEEETWSLGDTAVAAPSGRTIYARADFQAPSVRSVFVGAYRLDVRPDEPLPRHALITGWPPPEETPLRKSLAQQLRATTTLRVRPN